MGGGTQLVPLGTSATNWPIILTSGDYEDGEFDGMMIGTGNQTTLRKPVPMPPYPPQIPLARPGLELGPPGWEAGD
jgi:hypothetical protein